MAETLLTSQLQRKLLRTVREQADLTLEELAERTDLSVSMLSLFERGERDLSPAAWERVFSAMEEFLIESNANRQAEIDKLKRERAELEKQDANFFGVFGFTAMNLPAEVRKQNVPADAEWQQLLRQISRRLLRIRAGLTQIELANAAKIHRKKIIKWEARDIELTYEEQDRLMGVIYDAIAKREPAPLDSPVYQKAFAEDTAAFNAHLPKPLSLSQLLSVEPVDLIEQRKSFVDRLENLQGIDDPVIAEIIESYQREIATLEKQLAEKTPVTPSAEEGAD